MKIVYLASIDISEFNAPANHVRECVGAMSKQHDVMLISARRRILQGHPVLDGVTQVSVAFPKINGGWRYFERRAAQILSKLGLEKNDVVYLRSSPSWIIARALQGMTCRKVLEVNGMEASVHPSFGGMMDVADIVLVGTESTRKELIQKFRSCAGKVRVHSNIGFDGVNFRPKDKARARKDLGLPGNAKLALHVSGFQSHHDYETLLRSAELIKEEDPDFQLIMVGDGDRRADVMASAPAHSGAVHFPGAVGMEALSNYIAAADVCINAMTREKLVSGNGNAQKTVEYFACERPVIETVDPGQEVPLWLAEHAVCIPPCNVAAMVGAIQKVFEEPAQWGERAAAAREMLLVSHSWDAVVGNTLSIIERARSSIDE